MAYLLTVTREVEYPDGRVEPLGTVTITGRGTPFLARASRLKRLKDAGTRHRTFGGLVEVRTLCGFDESATEVERLEWSDPDQPSIEDEATL